MAGHATSVGVPLRPAALARDGVTCSQGPGLNGLCSPHSQSRKTPTVPSHPGATIRDLTLRLISSRGDGDVVAEVLSSPFAGQVVRAVALVANVAWSRADLDLTELQKTLNAISDEDFANIV